MAPGVRIPMPLVGGGGPRRVCRASREGANGAGVVLLLRQGLGASDGEDSRGGERLLRRQRYGRRSEEGGAAHDRPQRELKTGFFGCWHEKNGHGEVVEWTDVQHGWELRMVERDGLPVVPSLATAISWVLQMAKGHAKWRVAAFLTRNLQDMNICVRFRAAV